MISVVKHNHHHHHHHHLSLSSFSLFLSPPPPLSLFLSFFLLLSLPLSLFLSLTIQGINNTYDKMQLIRWADKVWKNWSTCYFDLCQYNILSIVFYYIFQLPRIKASLCKEILRRADKLYNLYRTHAIQNWKRKEFFKIH